MHQQKTHKETQESQENQAVGVQEASQAQFPGCPNAKTSSPKRGVFVATGKAFGKTMPRGEPMSVGSKQLLVAVGVNQKEPWRILFGIF